MGPGWWWTVRGFGRKAWETIARFRWHEIGNEIMDRWLLLRTRMEDQYRRMNQRTKPQENILYLPQIIPSTCKCITTILIDRHIFLLLCVYYFKPCAHSTLIWESFFSAIVTMVESTAGCNAEIAGHEEHDSNRSMYTAMQVVMVQDTSC